MRGSERTDRTNNEDSGSIFFVRNGTALLRFGGFAILTDPTFILMHEQTWLEYGLHTTRLTNPSIEIDDLPPLDFVLLSHFHGDHFDQFAETRLPKELLIVTTGESSEALAQRGFTNTRPLATWQSTGFEKGPWSLNVTATPGRHGPPLSDYVLPDVMGTILDFRRTDGDRRFRICITGDTLVIDELRELPRRFPEIDLALLHLGGTRVFGILVTMDCQQGVEMMRIVDPNLAIPIHYNDYDVVKSPLSDFQEAVRSAGLENRVHYLTHGETYSFRAQSAIASSDEPIRQTDVEPR